MIEYTFPHTAFFRLWNTKTKQFYITRKGKTYFSSIGHIKSSLKQRYGSYNFSGYSFNNFNFSEWKIIEYSGQVSKVADLEEF